MPGIADAVAAGESALDAIARWLQDVAYLDLIDAGLEADGVVDLRRGRLRVEALPPLRRARSSCARFAAASGASRPSGGRPCAARRRAVEAVALWVWIDAETRRPRGFGSEFAELYGESAAGRDAGVRLAPPRPARGCGSRSVDVSREPTSTSPATSTTRTTGAAGGGARRAASRERIDAEIEYREPALPARS